TKKHSKPEQGRKQELTWLSCVPTMASNSASSSAYSFGPARPEFLFYSTTSLFRRNIRVGRGEFDRRIFLQAFLEITDDLRHRIGDPRVIDAHVALLLQIGKEVDELGQRQSQRWVVHVHLPYKMRFPVPPLDGGQTVSHIGGEAFAVGRLLFAKEEVQLVYSVNCTILRDLCATYAGEGRVHVHAVNDLVVDVAGWHFTRPTNDERRTQ